MRGGPPWKLLTCRVPYVDASATLAHLRRAFEAVPYANGFRLHVQPDTTGIPAILPRHSAGPVSCTDTPLASTATVTGMSLTSNS